MRQVTTPAAVCVVTASLALPPAGAWLAGRALKPLLRFPPSWAMPADYPRFSWIAGALIAGAALAIAGPWLRRWHASPPARSGHLEVASLHPPRVRSAAFSLRRFPWWGWVALGWTLLWWWLAWTRQPWCAWAQRYTFTPLWLGFIVTVNALACGRGGTCLMRRAPGKWMALFSASAAFWWVFEWLNRFVHNWHYLGAADIGALEYAVHASVCFSTVLPAVAGVREWLGMMTPLQGWLRQGPAWPWLCRPGVGAAMMATGTAGLALTGAQPLYFFPTLWAAPLLIGVGWSVLGRTQGWWGEVATGDWREAGSWALSALVCGFFWELWNLHSLAKWVYAVPFVQRWQIFEMPLLGYTGYLPFGLECGLAVAWVLGRGKAAGQGDEQNRAGVTTRDPPARGP